MSASDSAQPTGAIAAALPADETERLRALRAYGILDTAAERVFDDITELASLICGTPIALISLVDQDRQWFKSAVGLAARETPREQAFCAHAILDHERTLVVTDAAADPRFAGNPLVTGDPNIRFYAGAPILTEQGHALGTVCAIDRVPRRLSADQLKALRTLSRQVGRLLEWRRLAEDERRRQLAEVRIGQERLAQVTAMASHALSLQAYVDLQGTYQYVNRQYETYWQVRGEDLIGRNVRDVIGAALFDEQVHPALERAFQGEVVQFDIEATYPVLGNRVMNARYLPVKAEDGSVCGAVICAEDMHELATAHARLQQAHEQLMHKNVLQERFIHMISHDIREPVNTICNFTGLLQEDHAQALDAAGQRYLGFVRQGGQRMQSLLDGLLTYVRMEGQGLERQEAVSLDRLFAEVMTDLDAAVKRHGAAVQPNPLPAVQGDPLLLRVLFQNLLANALKFHRPEQPPQVSWGGQATPAGFEVWVQDAGIGIDPAQQGRLFSTFSRLVTRRQFEGSGLGLATCKRVADMHGGSIEVTSAPGQGSRFTVRLPAQPAKQGSSA